MDDRDNGCGAHQPMWRRARTATDTWREVVLARIETWATPWRTGVLAVACAVVMIPAPAQASTTVHYPDTPVVVQAPTPWHQHSDIALSDIPWRWVAAGACVAAPWILVAIVVRSRKRR